MTGAEAARNIGGMDEGTGIYAENCWNISLQQVNASDNNFAGIDVEDSARVSLVDVTADANLVGLILGGDTIQVTGCVIRDSVGPGIGMYDSTNATFWNNYFLNEENVDLSQGVVTGSSWNISKAPGLNIVNGPFLGGNYWAKPDGTGWSQITPDRGDGFCNASFVLDVGNVDLLPLVYYPAPVANFTAAPTGGRSPLTVRFQDESTGNITDWHWSFGDGQISELQNPEHQYTTVGRYSVTLNVTGPTGQSELTRPDLISVTMPVSDGDDGSLAAMSYDETGFLVTGSQGTVLAGVEVDAGDSIGTLVISKGVVARDKDGKSLREVTIVASGAPAPEAGAAFALTDYAYTCGPAGATFSPAIALVFSFTGEEWEALMAGGRPLTVMRYNEVTGAYEGVPTSVNAVTRTVTAHVTRFSVFALMHAMPQGTETPVPTTVVPTTASTASLATPLTTPPPTLSTPTPTATAAGANFPVTGVLVVLAFLAIAGGNVFRRR
jgi:PKD repeat protein